MITTIELVRVGARNAQIKGSVIQTVSAATVAQPRDEKWSEVTLLEGPGLSWIVIRKWAVPGLESLVGEYFEIERPKVSNDPLSQLYGGAATEEEAIQKMADLTMNWLEHSFLAKELAATQGWKVVEQVGYK